MYRIGHISSQMTGQAEAQEPSTISYAGANNCIGILSIFQEKSYNALTPEMRGSIIKNLQTLEKDPKIKVICLRSLHPKVFCAGANIKEFETAEHSGWINEDLFKDFDLTFRYLNKPIIAAVHKLALGGGFEIALHCDVILAAENTFFGLPEIKLGLFPGIGGTLISKSIGK